MNISGVINEDGQLVDDGGMAYDIAENEEGDQLLEMIGQKVAVKGTVMEEDGTKVITVTEFKLLKE